MLGIGIDTGGTCTDAVIIDTVTREVLSFAKSPTTKNDLKIGIINSLSKLNPDLLRESSFLSLSTTLATNACVENKGGRAKLVFIGLPQNAVERMRGTYGLPDCSEIYFLKGDAAKDYSEENSPDWEQFSEALHNELSSYDSIAVVQINPSYNNGEYENKAAELIKNILNIPCVKGYDLYQEINVQKRGATALLNARLLPIMEEFFDSIKAALKTFNLNIPIKVVKSDGSIMSESFARERPVETLLCGPAACIIGALELSEKKDALILDMGGTTSDVALIKDRRPVSSGSGISIGPWKTMVKGISIDTFALGGDSSIEFLEDEIILKDRRVIPLCMLADEYPSVVEDLSRILSAYANNKNIKQRNVLQLYNHETHFLLLVKKPKNTSRYTKHELELINILENGPMTISDATAEIGLSIFTFSTSRLEDEGVIMRSGVTPTDVMHVLGDYTEYTVEASKLAIEYLSYAIGKSFDDVCSEVYGKVKEKLYLNIARILYKYSSDTELSKAEFDFLSKLCKQLTKLGRNVTDSIIKMHFTGMTGFIGIGAPTSIFMDDVASELGMDADFPEYASVANAIGAAMGKISEKYSVTIEPNTNSKIKNDLKILGGNEVIYENDYKTALEVAKKIAEAKVITLVEKAGAVDGYQVELHVEEDFFDIPGKRKTLFVSTVVTGTIECY